MAGNTYVVEDLALPGRATVTIADDGKGQDWLVMGQAHQDVNVVTLQWSFANGAPAAASGSYSDGVGKPGNRLVVNGLIENARGADGQDDIRGNVGANILYGDPLATGAGARDTLYGDAGTDTLYGGAGGDVLDGGLDGDRIWGDAGADSISGGAGRDTVAGGTGADTLYGGGDLGDTLDYRDSAEGVFVTLTHGAATTGQNGDAEGDTIGGFTAILGSESGDRLTDSVQGEVSFDLNANRFDGRGGADTLRMGGGDDTAYGGDSRDEIEGEAGDDRLQGDEGNDDVRGGDGADTVWGDAGFDLVDGGAGADAVHGGDEYDKVYGGDGGDRLWADAGDDLIFGNDGDDRLYGGDGADTLYGDAGLDRLAGGAGADEFRFFRTTDGGDTITDFGGGDVLVLRFLDAGPLHWDTSGSLGKDGARIVDKGADVVVQVNADADAAIEFKVTLLGVGSLSQGQVDF